jgi:pimeloyl-ACP methyl ester carboxylesterase
MTRLGTAALAVVFMQVSPIADLTIDGPAGALHATDGGAGGGPAVVFIPSLAGTIRQWSAQLDHIRRTRRAVAIEVRGHGRSAVPKDADYSLDAMARDVDAVVRHLGISRAVVVGHSMGGGVALAYAAAHPERVAGLFLVDPIDDPSRQPAGETAEFIRHLQSSDYAREIEAYWTQILAGAAPGVAALVLEDLRRTPRDTVLGAMNAMARFNATGAIDRYPGPIVSVITRFNDVASSLHRVAPSRVRSIPIDGTSHWIQMDKPDELNRVLDEFAK